MGIVFMQSLRTLLGKSTVKLYPTSVLVSTTAHGPAEAVVQVATPPHRRVPRHGQPVLKRILALEAVSQTVLYIPAKDTAIRQKSYLVTFCQAVVGHIFRLSLPQSLPVQILEHHQHGLLLLPGGGFTHRIHRPQLFPAVSRRLTILQLMCTQTHISLNHITAIYLFPKSSLHSSRHRPAENPNVLTMLTCPLTEHN